MPLYNENGHPMPYAELTPFERGRMIYLGTLVYPQSADHIFHLSPSDFRKWLYQLNPREALILTSTSGISERIKKQLSWKRWSILTDWVWRLFH